MRFSIFQSTLPAGGATFVLKGIPSFCSISIHAPRGGSDKWCSGRKEDRAYFNPRSPRGERPINSLRQAFQLQFQSTLPAGGATRLSRLSWLMSRFQSTLPAGGATQAWWAMDLYHSISIHAPRGGSDIRISIPGEFLSVSQSTLPAGGATRLGIGY